jgi:hypothetical protein
MEGFVFVLSFLKAERKVGKAVLEIDPSEARIAYGGHVC